jgi:hypothetical protein
VETEPLRLVPRAQAAAIAWPGVPAPPPQPPPPSLVEAVVPPAVSPIVPPAAAPVAGVAAPAVVGTEPEIPPQAPPAPEVAEPPSAVQPSAERSPANPSPPPAPPPPAAPAPTEPGTVNGRVSGPAWAAVRAVTVLGPDNVLKEAARIVPDASGRYTVPGLRTGSYRIIAAGENGRVLVCDPPYVTVKVSPGAAVEAPALDVLRAY